MHDSYIIHGGRPLRGEIELAGAKNASIKLMIASLLMDGPVVLHRVPQNGDNKELMSLLHDLGVSVEFSGHTVTVNASTIRSHEVSMLYGSKVRSSFLLFGPLLHRFGEAHIPNPGGCRIGARPIERIINGIRALGVEVNYNHETGYYDAKLIKPLSGEYTFEKPTHTGTEALVLLAACGTGEVALHNCALEPEIDDLILLLNNCGAHINRNGKDIFIKGAKSLRQTSPHMVIEDRNEAVTYAAMAYITCGDITLTNIHASLIQSFIEKVTEIGVCEITPVICDRSERKDLRIDRLEKILVSACKQSLKYTLPKLNSVIHFKQFVAATNGLKRKYIAYCDEKAIHLKDAYHGGFDSLIMIGPEGDFSRDEILLAEQNEFETVSLGKSRLRLETAGIYSAVVFNLANER